MGSEIAPVTQAVFLMLKEWLKATWKNGLDHPEIGKAALKKELSNVQNTLMGIMNSTWPTDPKEYLFFKFQNQKPKSAQSRASSFNRCMTVACRENHFRLTIRLSKEGDRFRLAWFRTKRPSPIQRVLWLHAPFVSEFNSLLMLGALSMAKEFKLDLSFHKTEPGENVQDHVEEVLRRHSHNYKADKAFRKATAVVFDMLNSIDVSMVVDQHLAGFHVVTTGVSGALVTQDNNAIGRMLANLVLNTVSLPKNPKIAVLSTPGIANDRTIGDRVRSFEQCLNDGMARRGDTEFCVAVLDMDCVDARHMHSHQEGTPSNLNADALSTYDAIVTPFSNMTEWLMSFLRHGGVGNPQLFSMDVSPNLLVLMLVPNSQLRGMVGVDPYSYGRLIIRAAFDPQLKIAIPPAKPIVVTQKDVQDKGIQNYAQLLMEYPLAQLNEPEFAWKPWMASFCPFSYGPAQVEPKKSHKRLK